MSNIDKKLLQKLVNQRDLIKWRGRARTGRAPIVCSEEAIVQIATLCPKKLEDFYNIKGLGNNFVEEYGEEFLEVIQKYGLDKAEADIKITKEIRYVLKELEKKLTSLNKRNRMLYCAKTSARTSVDFSQIMTRVDYFDVLFGNKKFVVKNTSDDEGKLYTRCRAIVREASKDYRDKGHNNLYLGFPFVKGRMLGENFDLRAPLMLFPIKADWSSERIVLGVDEEREIQFNNTLILAFYKFNNIKDSLPDESVGEIAKENFINEIISHYKKSGISIQSGNTTLIKFEEYKKGEFPKFNNGELFYEPCAVLGKFPVCDSSIQKDFDTILENNTINSLLKNLLEGYKEGEIFGDSFFGEYYEDEYDDNRVIVEKDLNYINDLNSSQELVLKNISEVNELVVQGPPGTGKSQTIASLIADAAIKGKTVLMVSEKKTALNVVYSRLGDLAKYALMIENVENKTDFYRQLEKMMYESFNTETHSRRSIKSASKDIDTIIENLEDIAIEIYSPNEKLGIEPYKLFVECNKYDLEDERDDEVCSIISEQLDSEILDWKYIRVRNCFESFSNSEKLKDCSFVNLVIKTYPFYTCFIDSLSSIEINNFKKESLAASEAVKEWNQKGFFSRLFSKTELLNTHIVPLMEKYTTIPVTKDKTKWVMSIINQINEFSSVYKLFFERKPVYDLLTEDELLYLDIINRCAKELVLEKEEANSEIYNYILYCFVDAFMTEHRYALSYVKNYPNLIKDLSLLFEEKKTITRKEIKCILSNSISDLFNCKRGKDIRRVVENKRKMSVNRFIRKFSFELFNYIQIWLLTPEVVSELIPLENGIFDLVIFDEASQMYVEKGLPSILRGKKVVIAGDSKQLRPTNIFTGRIDFSDEESFDEEEEMPASLEEESLLDLAKSKYKDVLLNYHYRSKYEELIAFSNHAFYRGNLYVSPNVDKPEKPPIEVCKIDDALWSNRSNLKEALYVVQLIKNIFATRENNETIGVITFNITQRDLIDDLLEEECSKDYEFGCRYKAERERKEEDGQDIGLFVKNLETVQGDERDIIIFSTGYAKNDKGRLVRNFGWLNNKGGENRLNVAVSRAKNKVYVVTSINPSELQVEDAVNNGPRLLKKYLEYAWAVSNNDVEMQKNILHSFGDQEQPGSEITFDSVFEEEVYEALAQKGYIVDTQVGIGGYRIDMAIKYHNKYILGVECDGRLYHSSKSARERDYHRQKYLESRGWKIYRIWSTKWWDNSLNEIEKLTTVIDSLIADEEIKENKLKEKSEAVVEQENIVSIDDFSIEQELNKIEKTNRKTTTVKHNSQISFNLIDSDEKHKKRRCENCKLYRNEQCAGLGLCSDYEYAPGDFN